MKPTQFQKHHVKVNDQPYILPLSEIGRLILYTSNLLLNREPTRERELPDHPKCFAQQCIKNMCRHSIRYCGQQFVPMNELHHDCLLYTIQ